MSDSGGDNEQKPWYERTLGLIGTGCSINPACAVEMDVIRSSEGKERKREGGGGRDRWKEVKEIENEE